MRSPSGRRAYRRDAAAALLALAAAACGTPAADTALARCLPRLEAATAVATTAESAPECAALLWECGNAFALAGGVLPVDLPEVVAYARRADRLGRGLDAGLAARIDHHLRELAVKLAHPQALGTLSVEPGGPLAAGSLVTLRQTYTVGGRPLARGAVVLLGKQLVTDQGRYQHVDPAAEGYVSVQTSRAEARFTPIELASPRVAGVFRAGGSGLAFRLEGADLDLGESFTVVYGDRSGGSPGFRVQSFATDELHLPLFLDPDGSGTLFTLAWPALRVVGGPVERVRAVAPSTVAVGEPFAIRIRSADRAHNRASGAVPGYRVRLDGETVASVPPTDDPLARVEGLTLGTPGVYRFEVVAQHGSLRTTTNPIVVRDRFDRRILWGELHGHTGMAEGQGTAGRFYEYARDDAALDFAGLSEHDSWLDDAKWAELERLAGASRRPGVFTSFLGYEWSSPRELGGHHNVFYLATSARRIGGQEAPALPDLYRGLASSVEPAGVLVIPHAHQAADWTRSDPALERLVELYSMHGTFEWFANLYLRNGFRIGFVGASDDHRAAPGLAPGIAQLPLGQSGGLTAAVAAEPSPESLFSALRGLSTYATSGERIVLEATLNGYPMGTRQPQSRERRLEVRVAGIAAIDHIDVVRNGSVVYSRRYLQAPLAPRSTLQLGFESSSEVLAGSDNPRPYRIWEGTLEVEGARLLGLQPVGLDNDYREHATIEGSLRDRARFRIETRGRRDTLLLELDRATAATALRLRLRPAREEGYTATLVRPPAEIPGAELVLRLDELVDGALERELRVGGHVDRVRVQPVDPDGALDRSLSYTDAPETPGDGDYYYVRVTQLDGARAWSSPFWVGSGPDRATQPTP